jgi:predicted transcriptional regulator
MSRAVSDAAPMLNWPESSGTEMATTTITFEIDENLKQQFAEVARAHHCSAEELLPHLVREFVEAESDPEYNEWFRQQVQIGLDDANAGRMISSEEVEAEFAARRAETLRKLNGEPS